MITAERMYHMLKKVINPKYELIVTDNITLDHVMSYHNTDSGVLIVYPLIIRDTILTFNLIFIDKLKGIVHCCNTKADTMNCNTFLTLSDLRTKEGPPFTYIQHRIGCYREDVLLTVFLTKLLTNNYSITTVLAKNPTDEFLVEQYGSLLNS